MEGLPDKKAPIREGRYHKIIAASMDSTDTDQNWLITLSDVLSLLLVFFIIFFAMSRVSGLKKEVPKAKIAPTAFSVPQPVPESNGTLEAVRHNMKAAVAELNLDDQISVQVRNQEIIITLKENVTFPSGEAVLLKSSEPILDTIADLVHRYPSFMVEVDGHTDDSPINTRRFPSNWELSVARATSVLKYLITKHHLDPSRFTVKGNADQRPLTDNESPEHKAQNRRVEIRLKEIPGI